MKHEWRRRERHGHEVADRVPQLPGLRLSPWSNERCKLACLCPGLLKALQSGCLRGCREIRVIEGRGRRFKPDQDHRMKDVHAPVSQRSRLQKDDGWLIRDQPLFPFAQVRRTKVNLKG